MIACTTRERDDLRVCDPAPAVSWLLRQEIVGRAINGREESVEVGVHRGLLIIGVVDTADSASPQQTLEHDRGRGVSHLVAPETTGSTAAPGAALRLLLGRLPVPVTGAGANSRWSRSSPGRFGFVLQDPGAGPPSKPALDTPGRSASTGLASNAWSAYAYSQAMRALADLSVGTLDETEQEVVREAADALLFCEEGEASPAAELALAAFYDVVLRSNRSRRKPLHT